MSVPARGHKGGAKPTSLSGPLSNTALSFTVTAGGGTGFPDGTDGAFIVLLDATLAGEEKVLCSSRSADTFTVAAGGRGYDNTAAAAHANLAVVTHTYSAIEAQEANDHIRASAGVHGLTGAVVGTTDPQTLTNKTLTNPVINGTAVTTDPVNYLNGANIAQAAVGFGSPETTTSAPFTDLPTVGPSVTVTVPSTGRVLIVLSAQIYNTTAFQYAAMGWVASGANTIAATEAEALIIYSGVANQYVSASEVIFKSGLTPGATTFKAVYKAGGGTLTAQNRRILVIPC